MTKLVLFTGWGFNTTALQPLAKQLTTSFAVSLRQLPDISASNWLQQLTAELPERCWLGGWSLGGMLAALLAERMEKRCQGLITIASNPCFVQQVDWPTAMQTQQFEQFYASFKQQPDTCLASFSKLCSLGDGKQTAKQLATCVQIEAHSCQQLRLLQQLDIRRQLRNLSCPQLHLFASNDALVPAATAVATQQLIKQLGQVLTLPASHALPFSQPQLTAQHIAAFIRQPWSKA